MKHLIVADAGPLIALARIDALDLLTEVASRIVDPDAVAAECTPGGERPGSSAIRLAFESGLLTRGPTATSGTVEALPGLGPGESAAIALAAQLDARVLIDEKRARRVATGLGLHVVGTLAVLVIARRRGRVSNLRGALDALQAAGYFVSAQLVAEALQQAGE